MADTDASGKGDVKSPVESSASFVRPDTGDHPNTSLNPFGEFQHKEFDASYDHNPFTSVNPPAGTSSSSKYIHPFMLERFIDAEDNPRLRVYSGNLYTSINVIKTEVQSDYMATGSKNDSFITIHSQKAIEGVTAHAVEDPTGNDLTALVDEDGEDTVHKAYDFPVGQAYGTYYLTWQLTIGDDQDASTTVANVKLFRHPTTATDTKIGVLEQDAAGASLTEIKRNSMLVMGTYHIKLGESFDPADGDTNSKTIDQIVHENVYWQPLIVGESG